VLVPGNAATVDAATLALLDSLGVEQIKIAGGTGGVSATIESQLNGVFGNVNVDRNAGSNRYLTAITINADEFETAPVVYLATGEGFADALAGAALAGRDGAPLFISPGNCIPQGVLTAMNSLGTSKLVLLGGTGVLSANVANLVACG
jgi:putative cell wall-binding protein